MRSQPDDHLFRPVAFQTGCLLCGYSAGHHPTTRQLRQQQIIDHNREMLKLRVTGQAYRDKLISERLRLRSTSEHHHND